MSDELPNYTGTYVHLSSGMYCTVDELWKRRKYRVICGPAFKPGGGINQKREVVLSRKIAAEEIKKWIDSGQIVRRMGKKAANQERIAAMGRGPFT